jgi:NAD(P)-dependent dehydrogenase (short-subunit alcohol dehydrogenase family)
VSLQGKVCLITGATDGVGKVTARELARLGATVVGVGRNPAKIDATLAQIKREMGSESVEFLKADLSSQAEIRALADEFRQKYDRLHILVNNAGAFFTSYRETVDGLEMTFALNHLAYFLLTTLLLDVIKASAPARIVNVASDAHSSSALDFDDLNHRDSYNGWDAYSDSKLENILFTTELARRLAGTGVTANTLNPGFVNSNFQKAAGLNFRGHLTPDEGADTQIWLATSPDVADVTGRYYVRRRETQPSASARDDAAARRLWEVSAGMVGLDESEAE